MYPYNQNDEIIVSTKSQTKKEVLYEVCFSILCFKNKIIIMLLSLILLLVKKLLILFWKGSIPDRNYTEDEIYNKLNELSRQYYHLDEGLTSHKNRYKELLHLCFPKFELCFKDEKLYDLTALNLIKEFPHAYIIKEKRVDALDYNMANTNNRHLNYYKKKANTIKEYAINSYPGVNENSKAVNNLKQLSKIIIDITEQ